MYYIPEAFIHKGAKMIEMFLLKYACFLNKEKSIIFRNVYRKIISKEIFRLHAD